jgi:hypothetical protein
MQLDEAYSVLRSWIAESYELQAKEPSDSMFLEYALVNLYFFSFGRAFTNLTKPG